MVRRRSFMDPDDYDPIAAALREDIGKGDITTEFFVPETLRANARIIAHEPAVVAGTETAAEIFRKIDPTTDVQIVSPDGQPVVVGDIVIELRGLARSILKAERVALNFLQRLCGVATLTRQFVDAVGNHPAEILDTRKTTPGLRTLEKAAVLAGGGVNHRSGLYDMVLIKENHVALAGGVGAAVRAARAAFPDLALEVECRTRAEVDEALDAGAPRILLDNMGPDELRETAAHVAGRAELEASGGIVLEALRAPAN